MKIRYLKYSPTGNLTVLVTTPVPREDQPGVAARLLESDCVGGEQVGFIERPTLPGAAVRLQMMGGEFCGNATMSVGAMLARSAKPAEGECLNYAIEVSGLSDAVPCRVCRKAEGWVGAVRMPLPERVGEIALDTDAGPLTASLVEMPGIAHLILPVDAAPIEDELRRRLPEWNRRIRADALGALVWSAEDAAIDPLVYVPSTGTLVREHGCGSGTAAIGSALALAAGHDVEAAIHQPGGTITVRAGIKDGRIADLTITGNVTLVEEGDVTL